MLHLFTDAGDGIGYGHMMRMQALSKSLKTASIPHQLHLYQSGEPPTRDWLGNALPHHSLVVVDSYRPQAYFYQALQRAGNCVVAIDDYQRIDYPTDWVLNPNVAFEYIPYQQSQAKIIGGAEWVILRPEFTESLEPLDPPSHVTITLGGRDIRNLLPRLLPLAMSWGLPVEVVCGHSEGKEALNNFANEVTLHGQLSALEMLILLRRSRYLLCAAGQTLNEAAFLGIPTVSICVAEDQRFILEAFYQSEFLPARLYWDSPHLETEINTSLQQLQDPERKKAYCQSGQKLIDGQGAMRLAKWLGELLQDMAQS